MISFSFRVNSRLEVNPKGMVAVGMLKCSDLDFVHSNA